MKLLLLAATLSVSAQTQAAPLEAGSHYTNLKPELCKVLQDSSQDPDSEGDYFEARCKGREGFDVHFTSGDSRSWLVFKKKKVSVDTYEIVMSHPAGFFPNLSSEKLEWRYTAKGQLKAVIFRIASQDQDDYTKSHSQLFVVGLKGPKGCFYGTAKTNDEARTLADKATKCLPELKK